MVPDSAHPIYFGRKEQLTDIKGVFGTTKTNWCVIDEDPETAKFCPSGILSGWASTTICTQPLRSYPLFGPQVNLSGNIALLDAENGCILHVGEVVGSVMPQGKSLIPTRKTERRETAVSVCNRRANTPQNTN